MEKSEDGKPPVVDGLFRDIAHSDVRTPRTNCNLCGKDVSNYYPHRVRHGREHVRRGDAVAYTDCLGRTLFFPMAGRHPSGQSS